MNYQYTVSHEATVSYLTQTLLTHIHDGEHVVWLLSGGSAIDTAVAVSRSLADHDLSKLSISLVDERFGPVGHADENWQQLLDRGFKLEGAELYRPLRNLERTATAQAFSDWLQAHITDADYSIGLFGIGADGHTAGIKPHTSATAASGWATDFAGEDFERVTMTFSAIKSLDEVVIQALGTDKAPVIERLLHSDISPDDQPAQVLKSVKKSTLFTDYKEGSV